MDELGATIALILLVVFVFAMFFFFAGDPDVWDIARCAVIDEWKTVAGESHPWCDGVTKK